MKNLLINVLSEIESKEKDYYLNKFHQPEPSKFALIKVSGGCVKNSLEQIVYDLNQLQQAELYPVVVFGWGSLLNKKLKEKGIKYNFIKGNRVTTSKTLKTIQEVIEYIKKNLFSLAEDYNLELADLTKKKIFKADQLDEKLGYVGKITDIDIDHVVKACNDKKIPFLVPLGYGNSIYNINADNAAKSLAENIKPEKYIALTPTGGILDKNKKIIQKISIVDDYKTLVNNDIVSEGMLKKINEAKELLEELKNGYSVQITSPKKLLSELFTYEGAGTKIVLGYNTEIVYNSKKVDKESLTNLIENGFGKKLIDGYFNNEDIKAFILEEDYDGAAVIEDFNGWAYLDKFVVSKKSRNNGLGGKIFSEIMNNIGNISERSGIFWRTNTKNSLNKWYYDKIKENNGGCQVEGKWIIYWTGNPGKEKDILIDYASNKKETLEEIK